jgi:glycosyltransferase involved in cell wall biosynthesis
VIVLIQSAPAFGAIESYLAAVARGLATGDEPAVLLYPDHPDAEPFTRLAGAALRTETYPVGLLDSAPAALAWLTRRLHALRPRVVHVNDPWPPALLAARLARVEQLLLTHHTPELPVRDSLIGRAWRRLGWLTRPEVIYTSERDRAGDARTRLTTHVVYYGIDLERFTGAEPALPRTGPVVGNVARLTPQKGQRVLIEAAPRVLERHPDVRFVLVGDGELRAELEQQAAAAGLGDRFLFTGARGDVPKLLASFDVFALPSFYEGLCYAVIEAQAAGVPVVATPVGGVPENVVPGETGVLCEPGDAGSLADGIVWLLDHPEEAARLAEEARRRASAKYSLERMVAETVALYARA